MQNLKDIGVAYIGDGAVEEGVVSECFNLAKVMKAPVLFVIENNLFASHMNISLRQPSEAVSRFADANHIPYKLLDGNDVVSVAQNSNELIDNIRNGNGPALLELITYRWYGHVDWREDIDVGVERSMEDIKNWKARDPIHRLSQSMINSKIWTMEEEEEIGKKIDNQITYPPAFVPDMANYFPFNGIPLNKPNELPLQKVYNINFLLKKKFKYKFVKKNI